MATVKKAVRAFGLPRIIIIGFFLLLLLLAVIWNMNIAPLIEDTLRRWSMYGILVLAMVPGIQCGIGPNFGVTIGIEGGLVGALISVELRYHGFFNSFADNPALDAFMGILVALVLATVISGILGVLYGLLLNRVKGSEMTVSTYVGFSVVALMNIMWLVLPFRSPTSIWPLAGEGLRNTLSLADDFSGVFNNFLGFRVAGAYVPTGMILVFFLMCFLMYLFGRSRTGNMMMAAGTNPTYARAAGINVDKMRIIGTALSTALGGIGIVCYAQTFGFLQLYNAPQMMGFACVAAIFIGGASVGRARILNVLLGTFLFQGILAVALPVANTILPEGNLSEIFRIIISNGIILYALTKSKEVQK